MRALTTLALGLLLLGAWGATTASADHGSRNPVATQLRLVQVAPYEIGGKVERGALAVTVRLAMADGRALPSRAVELFEKVEYFGPRLVRLGAADTDVVGVASFVYRPAETGERTLVARYAGDDAHRTSEQSFTVAVTEVQEFYATEPLPLSEVRQWLPLGVGAVVLGVWAVLAGIFVRTLIGIRRAAQ